MVLNLRAATGLTLNSHEFCHLTLSWGRVGGASVPITFCNIFARNLIFINLADRWSVNWFQCVTHATRPININALLISGFSSSRLCGQTQKRGEISLLPLRLPPRLIICCFRFFALAHHFKISAARRGCVPFGCRFLLFASASVSSCKNAARNNFQPSCKLAPGVPTAACAADWKTRTLSARRELSTTYPTSTAARVINKLMLPRPCPAN